MSLSIGSGVTIQPSSNQQMVTAIVRGEGSDQEEKFDFLVPNGDLNGILQSLVNSRVIPPLRLIANYI